MKTKFLFSLLCLLAWAVNASAVTGSYSAYGVTLNWTTTTTGGTYSVSGTYTQTTAANKGCGIHKDPWPGSWTAQFGNGNQSGSWSMTGLTGNQAMFLIEYTNVPPTTETGRSSFTITNTANYSITFQIPAVPSAADGGTVVHYEVRNAAGDVIGTHTAIPGDPATTLVINGLTTNEQLFLVRLEGKPVATKDEQTGIISVTFVSTGATSISDGTPQTGGVTIPAPSVNPTTPPVVPVAPTPSPDPTTPPSAPTPVGHTTPTTGPGNPTPTGGTGATASDIMAAANQISDRIRESRDDVVASGNAQIDAINGVGETVHSGNVAELEAIDKVAAAVVDTGNANVEGFNNVVTGLENVNTTVGQVRDKITETNSKLDVLGTKLDDIKTNTDAAYTPATAATAYGDASTAQSSGLNSRGAELNAVLVSSVTAPAVLSSDVADADDSIYEVTGLGDGPQKLLGTSVLKFKLGDVAPNWKNYAGWLREAVLFMMGISFCMFTQRKFETYYLAWWGVGEKTTKPELSQVAVPGVGWGKQLATTLTICAVFTGTVAVAIAAVNTNLASLITSGSTVTNSLQYLTSGGKTVLESVGPIYGFMNAWLPIPAAFEYLGAYYIFGWLMAPIWTGALHFAKYFNI